MGLFGGKKDKKSPAQTGSKQAAETPAVDGDAPLVFSEKAIASARKWFTQAKKLTEDRNYDYAIESYLTGLKFWPEAVIEGHQPLRAAAFARRETGGKKPGTVEGMKHPRSGRDAIQAMLNAEWLWARDPTNLSYMQDMVKNAAKAACEETLLFIGPIFFDAAKTEKKLSKDRFILLRNTYQELGNRCERRGDLRRAIQFFEGAQTVLQVLKQLSGAEREYTQDLTDMATKVTIMKGKYDSAEDFRSSVKDSGAQKDIHDRERMVMDDHRLGELIDEARKDWEANREAGAKLLKLVDLLCRAEDAAREDEAIGLLDEEFARTRNYELKSRADNVRMRKLRRAVRDAAAGRDKEALRRAQIEQLKFELKVFKERVDHYPTDNKLKYELGRRLFTARKYDDAIPKLQEARNDPKNKIACSLLIGRCFFEKEYHSQAVSTFQKAIEEHDLVGDDLGKDLYYWMGRACELAGRKEEAEKAYGQLIQWDYNYRDVRDRLAALEE